MGSAWGRWAGWRSMLRSSLKVVDTPETDTCLGRRWESPHCDASSKALVDAKSAGMLRFSPEGKGQMKIHVTSVLPLNVRAAPPGEVTTLSRIYWILFNTVFLWITPPPLSATDPSHCLFTNLNVIKYPPPPPPPLTLNPKSHGDTQTSQVSSHLREGQGAANGFSLTWCVNTVPKGKVSKNKHQVYGNYWGRNYLIWHSLVCLVLIVPQFNEGPTWDLDVLKPHNPNSEVHVTGPDFFFFLQLESNLSQAAWRPGGEVTGGKRGRWVGHWSWNRPSFLMKGWYWPGRRDVVVGGVGGEGRGWQRVGTEQGNEGGGQRGH